MRNLLALLAAAGLTFVGVGWYLDWYKVQSNGNDVHITINKQKVSTDVRKGEEKVHKALEKGADTAKDVENTQAVKVAPN